MTGFTSTFRFGLIWEFRERRSTFHHSSAAADSCPCAPCPSICAPCPSIWSQLSTLEFELLAKVVCKKKKKQSTKCTLWLFNYPLSLCFRVNSHQVSVCPKGLCLRLHEFSSRQVHSMHIQKDFKAVLTVLF